MPVKPSLKVGQFIDQKYRKIAFKSFKVQKPILQIYIVHGFAEHSGCYDAIIDKFNQNGISCHIMDLPGHGNSEGIRGHIDDYSEYIDNLELFIKTNPYHHDDTPVFLLGHSLGGAIVHHFSIESETLIKGVVMSSPLIDLPITNKPLSYLFRFLARKDKTRLFPKPFQISVLNRTASKKRTYQSDPLRLHCISPGLYIELERMNQKSQSTAVKQKAPLLIFASARDKVVSFDATARYFKNIPSKDKKLIALGEAMHEILQEAEQEQILQIMIQWFKKRI